MGVPGGPRICTGGVLLRNLGVGGAAGIAIAVALSDGLWCLSDFFWGVMCAVLKRCRDRERLMKGGEKRCLNSELWHACAGPLVSLPTVGTRVVYFPQGHSEQVAVSTNKEVEGHIPNYPNLPPQLICQLHDVTMHADVETDEVYAQMTLQPLSPVKPRKVSLQDYTQQPPAQELIARDLHDIEWKFRHIFRGQPKRHLLTTGWSVFVSAKRLVAGDSVLFIWNDKNQLLLGIKRANRPQTMMPSSVLSSDSMHIGLLAAAAHAAATNSRFTIFYNPRASPSEFVVPLSKYAKAVFHTRVSVGMRFRMLFETEESSVRRYMGTVTGISDLDPVHWPNSHWRSVKVGWDESTAGDRQPRVSLWEIEPLTTFPMYPSLFPLRLKRPWHPGIPTFTDTIDEGNAFMWLRKNSGDHGLQSQNFLQIGRGPWLQQRIEPLHLGNEPDQYQVMAAAALQDVRSADALKQQFLHFQQHLQFPQQSRRSTPMLQQQIIQQMHPQQILNIQPPSLSDDQQGSLPHQLHQTLVKQPGRQQQTYQESFLIPGDQVQQSQPPFSSSLGQKSVFPDSSTSFSSCVQSMLGSMGHEGSVNLMNFDRFSQPILNEEKQNWEQKFVAPDVTGFGNGVLLPPFPGKEGSVEAENCNADPQNHTLFGVNIDSSNLLSSPVPSIGHTNDADVSNMPYATSCFQNSVYGCIDECSGLLQNAGEVDPPSRTFVKVYKSGSVGRSLDITRFSNYNELREELGQMFGIEGQLDDPLRSGWQLVFVDRENDVLLLGDDPWE
ncbi:hypothetical protein Taro_020282 [Colocasia esculenta]|uniref:Auxin response factor n=1 Tax=Colocasia esculenta TaxID=4460 RepID=A0A843UVV0_COLES|nr:hypothetical protein [Colocasia esculenta]